MDDKVNYSNTFAYICDNCGKNLVKNVGNNELKNILVDILDSIKQTQQHFVTEKMIFL